MQEGSHDNSGFNGADIPDESSGTVNEYDIGELEHPTTESDEAYRIGQIELLDRNPYIHRVRVNVAIKLIDGQPVFMEPQELIEATTEQEWLEHQGILSFDADFDEDNDPTDQLFKSGSRRIGHIRPQELISFDLDTKKTEVEWGSDQSSKLSWLIKNLSEDAQQEFVQALDNGETVQTSLIFGPKWTISHFGENGRIRQFNHPGPGCENISNQSYMDSVDRKFLGSNFVIFTDVGMERRSDGNLWIKEALVAEANIGTKGAQSVNVTDPINSRPENTVKVKVGRDLDSLHDRYAKDDPTLKTPEYPYNQFRGLIDNTEKSDRRWVGPAFSRFLQTQLSTESHARQVQHKIFRIDMYGNAVVGLEKYGPYPNSDRTKITYTKSSRVNVQRGGYLDRRLTYLTGESHKERRVRKLDQIKTVVYDAAFRSILAERGIEGVVEEVWRSEANRTYFLKKARDGQLRDLSYLVYCTVQDMAPAESLSAQRKLAEQIIGQLRQEGQDRDQEIEDKYAKQARKKVERDTRAYFRKVDGDDGRKLRGDKLDQAVQDYMSSKAGQKELRQTTREELTGRRNAGDKFAWPRPRGWDTLLVRTKRMLNPNYFHLPRVRWRTDLSIHGPKSGLHHATRKKPFNTEPNGSDVVQGEMTADADGKLEPTFINKNSYESRKRDPFIAAFDIYPPETALEAEQEKLIQDLINYVRYWTELQQLMPNTYTLFRDNPHRTIHLDGDQKIEIKSGNYLYNRGRVLFRDANDSNEKRSSQVEIKAMFAMAHQRATEIFGGNPDTLKTLLPLLDFAGVKKVSEAAKHDSGDMGEIFAGMALEANPHKFLGFDDNHQHLHHEMVFLQIKRSNNHEEIIDRLNEMAYGPKPVGGWGNWRMLLSRLEPGVVDTTVLEALHCERKTKQNKSTVPHLFVDLESGMAVVEELEKLFKESKKVGEDRQAQHAPRILEIFKEIGLDEAQAQTVFEKGMLIRRTPDAIVRTYDSETGEVIVHIIDAKTYLKPLTKDTACDIEHCYRPFLDAGMRLVVAANCTAECVKQGARDVFRENGIRVISGTSMAQMLEQDLSDDYPLPGTIKPSLVEIAKNEYLLTERSEPETITDFYLRLLEHPNAAASHPENMEMAWRYATILDEKRSLQETLKKVHQELKAIYST